jgi:MFS transporter, putative metabolite:H+ symporter
MMSPGSESVSASVPAPSTAPAAELSARLDRLPRWSLPPMFMIVLGLGMFYVQYDVFNINVSFAQTCEQIIAGCTPANAVSYIGTCIFVGLVGYAVGALGLGGAADRYGRHPVLIISMIVTGLGCLASTVAWDFPSFAGSRLITGIGIGADLAIINTYVNEVAPRRSRGRMTSALFLLAAVGGATAIWLSLLLTTPAAPWPHGLPFALAGAAFDDGWRWIYGIGAALAVVSILLRFRLPESPRWLIARGRLDDAESVVAAMERRAARSGPLPAPVPLAEAPAPRVAGSYRDLAALLRTPRYLRRFVVISLAWTFAYVTIYTFGGAFTPVLTGVGYAPSEAGMISAVGILGVVLAAIAAIVWGDRIERKYWMLLGAAITVVGALAVGVFGGVAWIVFPGALVLFLGQNLWVGPQYALTAESFPTRSRATAYALCDSVGHVGGGLGVFVVAGFLGGLSTLAALLVLAGFLLLAAMVNLAAPATRGRSLEEVSG